MFWNFILESEKINTFRGQTLMMQLKHYSIERCKAYRRYRNNHNVHHFQLENKL